MEVVRKQERKFNKAEFKKTDEYLQYVSESLSNLDMTPNFSAIGEEVILCRSIEESFEEIFRRENSMEKIYVLKELLNEYELLKNERMRRFKQGKIEFIATIKTDYLRIREEIREKNNGIKSNEDQIFIRNMRNYANAFIQRLNTMHFYYPSGANSILSCMFDLYTEIPLESLSRIASCDYNDIVRNSWRKILIPR